MFSKYSAYINQSLRIGSAGMNKTRAVCDLIRILERKDSLP